MTFRRLSMITIAMMAITGVAQAAPDTMPPALQPTASTPTGSTAMLAYRQYLKEQTDTLAGMTRSLAREIKDEHLDPAQSTYAPAHRYFARIAPIARLYHDLNARIDARSDAYEDGEADVNLSGFHRLEHGLFANKSTDGLAVYAARLDADARELRGRIAQVELTPSVLADAAARSARTLADETLSGREERYAKTDLWDFEANLDGIRQIVALLQSQARGQDQRTLAETATHFVKIDALLEAHKEGCGFKSFDAVSDADKAALRAATTALADDLAGLRGAFAMR